MTTRIQQQKELYQSEINRYRAELDNKLKELEILLLKAKIDSQSQNNSQSELPESESESD